MNMAKWCKAFNCWCDEVKDLWGDITPITCDYECHGCDESEDVN
jgi:hypothetical protein